MLSRYRCRYAEVDATKGEHRCVIKTTIFDKLSTIERHDRCSEVLCCTNGVCPKHVRMGRACLGVVAKCVKNDGEDVENRGKMASMRVTVTKSDGEERIQRMQENACYPEFS